MTRWGLLLFLLLLAPFARANDTAFQGVGGTPRPLKGEHAAIRMVSEKVVLVANENSFDTRAEFVFANQTPRRVEVQMGFPESYGGDVDEEKAARQTTFQRFATFVDHSRVAARRVVLNKPDAAYFDTYWLKTVTFAPHQTRRVRVEARSPYGGSAWSGFSRALSYSFTGGNWRGNVERSDLEVRVRVPGLWRAFAEASPTINAAPQPVAMTLETRPGEAILRRTWRNWEAQSDFRLGLEQTLPFWMEEPNRLLTPVVLQKSSTFRTGGKAGAVESFEGFPPAAFEHDGTTYVSFSHLEQRLNNWKEALRRNDITVSRHWNPQTRRVTLIAGPVRLGFRDGSREMEVRRGTSVQKVALPAPAMTVKSQYQSVLYVPLAPVARALGFSFAADWRKRALVLSRGTWPTR